MPSYQHEPEKAVLVGVILPDQHEKQVQEHLDELAFLADTAGAVVKKQFVQRIDTPNPRTFIGQGKIREIADYVKENQINLVIFDDELSASQLRNIEKELGCKILDRTNLILDIFARRAQTAYAKAQVELAQYQYLLPRLVGMWTHLERQRGGIGLRGPGEREIETDRRVVRDRIAKLKEELRKIDRQMATQRKHREGLVRVSLVGYTNVGKSTLMNLLSKSNVFAENKLFATLDTTVRKVTIGNLPFLLSDTVGFIRKLPHHLVESFKSTLDEVREADILLHVVDISHPSFEDQINTVNQTLQEIGAAEKTTIMVFNKIDAYQFIAPEEDDLLPSSVNRSLEEIQKSWIARANDPCVFISATQKINIDKLKEILYEQVKAIHITRYPYDNFLY
ncbi:MAG TPA: GTPase HflX [Bacteroidales bacterium]|nr:GTPase HflX [Bacteroidales bacterium]HPO66500.1 GTPase HflX [Bacteroidales bacterium]